MITEEGREEGSQEQCEVVEEAPSKRRNTRKGLEIKEEVQRKETGANTQVAEKIKRVKERLKREKGEKEKIQPTLRSFMDLRSGLLGPCGKPGAKSSPGNQVVGGRGLPSRSLGDIHREVGEIRREKESRKGKAGLLERYGWTEGGLRSMKEPLTAARKQPGQGSRIKEESRKGKLLND